MTYTDYMLVKLIVLSVAAFFYGLFGGFSHPEDPPKQEKSPGPQTSPERLEDRR